MTRAAATAVVALIAAAACSAAGPAPDATSQTFSLKAGESALARDGALRIGFDAVTADSRCPKGQQCVWAGDAVARVWLQQGAGPRQTFELHTAPGPAQAALHLGHELRLLRLEPHPTTGPRAADAPPVATLTLGRGPAAGPER